jgi:cystathionine beta-lyase
MAYNFDELIDRTQTNTVKYDRRKVLFGGDDVLPMWVADMDFRTPDFVIDAIQERLKHGVLGYTLHPDSFFEAISSWLLRRHGWEVKRNWMLFNPGVVPGINMAVHAFTQAGDQIVIQTPVYHPFFAAATDHGRHILRNPLKIVDGRYEMDFEDLRKKVTKRTKLFLLSHPHNPGGTVWSANTLQKLGDFCIEHGIVIVSDEIHADLILGEKAHIPLAKVSPEIAEITVTLSAASKTFNLAALSTSYAIISNKKLRDLFETVLVSWHVFMGNAPGTIATETALNQGEAWLCELLDYIRGNYEYVCQYMAANFPKLVIMPLDATYLLWMDFRALNLTHEELEHKMFREAKIGCNSGKMFGDEGRGFMRLNLAHPRAHVVQACEHIAATFGNL